MSDTPRTETLRKTLNERSPYSSSQDTKDIWEFARQLERELTEAWDAYGRERRLKLKAYQDFNALNPSAIDNSQELADALVAGRTEILELREKVRRLTAQLAMTPDDGYVPPKCQHNRQSGWVKGKEWNVTCQDCGAKIDAPSFKLGIVF